MRFINEADAEKQRGALIQTNTDNNTPCLNCSFHYTHKATVNNLPSHSALWVIHTLPHDLRIRLRSTQLEVVDLSRFTSTFLSGRVGKHTF